ncbi:MAG: hypothetical protein KTR31_39975 [Myxococcales bacterium]|nr:hypothetical protein [Myxococcales bacterium]
MAPPLPWLFLALGCAGPGSGPGIESQLESEVIALNQRMQLLQEELASCVSGAGSKTLYANLYQVLPTSGLQVDQRGGAVVITVGASSVFVDDYASDFRDDADMALDMLATALLLNPDYDVTVVGHTWNQPIDPAQRSRYRNHLLLSFWLAEALSDHLIDNYGVERSRFTVAGRGRWDPVDEGGEPSAHEANHRIEIKLVPMVSTSDPG